MTQTPHSIPLHIGIIHFTGIGGIGMSGIAEILHNLGYKVQGSDTTANANTERLSLLGIKIMIGQTADNIQNASVVVRSSAVKDTNPEIKAARMQHIPVILRAEMLAELMRLKTSIAIAGTHGKTTTTSLVASLFTAAGYDPTIINGGILNAYGTNARLGSSQWLIAEADESDGSFLKLPATIGVVTNIDPDHMEHFGHFDNLKQAFRDFIEHLPFYGFAVLCKDHPVVESLISSIIDRKIITYGIDSHDADIIATDIRQTDLGSIFNIRASKKASPALRSINDIELSTPGQHNVLNSLAAIAIALSLGFKEDAIKEGLGNFKGVKRRFTHTGTSNGVTFIDDYGHHPKEISVTLKTARTLQDRTHGRVIAVVQPHRYTRLETLFSEFCECFADADIVLVAPVYSAGESPIEGIDHTHLAEGIRRFHPNHVLTLEDEQELTLTLQKICQPGDMVVCLGAGSITKWANELPQKMAA